MGLLLLALFFVFIIWRIIVAIRCPYCKSILTYYSYRHWSTPYRLFNPVMENPYLKDYFKCRVDKCLSCKREIRCGETFFAGSDSWV